MKRHVWKRLVVTSIALAMAVSLFPQAPVSADGQGSVDEANGWVSWLPVTGEGDMFYPPMQAEQDKESQVAFSFVNAEDSHDGNGAIKAERKAKGGIQLHLDSANDIGATVLPKQENKVVVMASAWVWADDDAAGSTLASYAFLDGSSNFEDGAHFNSAHDNAEVRTLQKGWQELYFDVTQCKSLGFLYWQSGKACGVIRLDDFKLKYMGVNDPVCSFDNYTDDWNVIQPEIFIPSQNTDSQYIKYGSGSLKIDFKGAIGDTKVFLQSKFYNANSRPSNPTERVNGKLVPKFEGYTAKNFGFWIYNVNADFTINSNNGDRVLRINQPGWHYVNWEFGSSGSTWQTNAINIKEMLMHIDIAGTIYIDSLMVEYEKDDEVVAERFESNSNWFGQSENITCYDYAALDGNGNGKYVKESFTSAKLNLRANRPYNSEEIATTNWRNGGMQLTADANGDVPDKLGMWVYGDGNSGVRLGLQTRTQAQAESRIEGAVTEPVSIDFEGWRQIWFDLPGDAEWVYGIRWGNYSDEDAVVYIDKLTYEYPPAEPVNELVNGSKKLDIANMKINDTIGYRVNFVQDGFAGKDMLLVVAAYDAARRTLKVEAETVRSNNVGRIKGIAQITVDTPELLRSITRVKGFCWESDSLTPVVMAEALHSEIAGMPGIGDTTDVQEGTPTLTEVDVPPVTRTSPQTAQIGNTNPYQTLIYQTSDKLPESISGVALGDDGTALNVTRGTRGVAWAAGWLNDGEALYGKTETCYSSGLHTSADVNEWAMLKFSEPRTIKQINLLPRQGGVCFPRDYTVEISSDGENWTVVAKEKDKQATSGTDIAQYPITPTECSYVRVNVTKLNAEGNNYYFQLREIEAIDESGNNVGQYTYGTVPEGSNPLSTNEIFDYDEYFNSIFESGVKWVNIPHKTFWGASGLSLGEKENLKYLKDNGVNITYRFTHEIGDISEKQANALGNEFAKKVEPFVNALKDYVDVWQIANEENFNGKPYSPQKPKSYAIVVSKVADRIRELDPGCKIEIETALIDFEWTKNVMEAGLAGKIDIMGVHVYKEVDGADNMIEANGTFIQNGIRMYPEDHPYQDYREEITEYKKLMEKYNPGGEVWVTETSVNTGLGRYSVTEPVQAKYLAREYIYHQMLGVGPTCWWTLHSIKTGGTEWGLIDASNRRRDSWYALRNVANTMNNDFKMAENVSVAFSNGKDMIFDTFKNDGGVYQIPYWVMTKMRSANTGRSTDITVQGITVENAVAIDMITGTVQELNFETNGDTTVFKDMVARDYPMVIRINSDAQYGAYTGGTKQ